VDNGNVGDGDALWQGREDVVQRLGAKGGVIGEVLRRQPGRGVRGGVARGQCRDTRWKHMERPPASCPAGLPKNLFVYCGIQLSPNRLFA
jgi:hypothetical protein